MGEIESTRVDVSALLEVAGRYDGIADVVDDVMRTHVARLTFDGALAGRDYGARGDALRQSVDEVLHQMWSWARASREIASALRSSGDRYVAVDAHSSARLR